jgi:mono/diheme cytochrome c family protein
MIGAKSSICAILVALALDGCALFQTEAERGEYVAVKWCSECHRVGPDQPSGMRPGHVLPPPVAAPSFMTVAARPEVTAAWLDRFMREPHLPMPAYRLRDDERQTLITYMLSLKGAGS